VLTEVADGVHAHESAFLQTNGVVVRGGSGALVVDPGITSDELACLARDIRDLDEVVVAGWATHPHFDHVLWHPELGNAPRYATARCAAEMDELLADPAWRERVAEVLPEDIASEIPMARFGELSALPVGAAGIPWDGRPIRIVEHQGHAFGHGPLLIQDAGVLVAGDMLSDILLPLLELDAQDPIGDYLEGLRRLEAIADAVRVVIPGHGTVGDHDAMLARLELDRAYVQAVREGLNPRDPRLAESGPHGSWLPGVHEWQAGQLAARKPGGEGRA
jgi:glyoxylase-like metal-dependent hydrolase (beta-lactamase superfamily II)